MSSSLGMLMVVVLAGVAAAALAYAILQPRIAAERNAENRLNQYKKAETDSASKRMNRDRVQEQARRRRTLQSSLKDLETKQKERDRHTTRPTMQRRLDQAGLSISVRQFIIFSVVTGFVFLLVAIVLGLSLLLALGLAVIGGLGLPRFVVDRLRKRRQMKFIDEFPNAVDLIVRGVKSGLPLNDTLRMIAGETPEPVRSEFQKVIEAQQLGLSTAEAVERLYQNIPLSETNFFAIVIQIQSQAGGNLSEALGNLSRVLRDRKKMKGKIQAMSMEAKASGGIIGSLPIIVGVLVYLTTPDYIAVLFTTDIGRIVLLASAVWMALGIFTMKKMINFDF
ncbi:type II secretion system F family protein [Mangrovicella endophytica]|uniref:type II secretion system F family protein n=1 Tax=Mangrovicella endophytica TaxID=2066697 RepID=UPI000C9DF6C0|nr:type II secretion system F family protein [Mangrovicella endophytica]